MDFLQGKNLIDKNEEQYPAESLIKGRTLIFYYFTGYQCEPCRRFDVKLKSVYSTAQKNNIDLLIIVIPKDFDKETMMLDFTTNYSQYLAIPFEDELNEILKYNYGVTYIPYLVVVNKDGKVITKEGKNEIEDKGDNVLVTWVE